MWDTEKKFGTYIMDKLKREGIIPIRIESASTVTGMPDLYVLGHNNDWFIELKNLRGKTIKGTHWRIPWRPGQHAWAQQYVAHHTQRAGNQFLSSKYSWTFAGLKDGVLLIRMSAHNNNNVMLADDYAIFKFTLDEFKELNLHWFLRTHSQVVTPILHKGMTWGAYIYLQMKFDIEEVIVNHYHNINIPAPADIINEIAPELADKLTTEITSYEWCDSKFMGWVQRKIAQKACAIYRQYLDNNELK